MNIRVFYELSLEEQDEAIGKVSEIVLDDLYHGRKTPLNDAKALAAIQLGKILNLNKTAWRQNMDIMDYVWDISGVLAKDALYIPDEGSLVVRL